jgi:hypothetical protein
VLANDNRKAGGRLADGVLTIALSAGTGTWQPAGEQGPTIEVQAFGETAAPLTTPAPLIRVPEGTEIHASIHNHLSDTLRVFGLCERTGTACPALEVPAGDRDDGVQERPRRHLRILGDHHRHAALVQGGRRHPVVRRIHRRCARGESRC